MLSVSVAQQRSKDFRGDRDKERVSVEGDSRDGEQVRSKRKSARRSSKEKTKAAKREGKGQRSGNFRGDRGLQGVSVEGDGVSSERRRTDRRAARRSNKAEGVSLGKAERQARRQSKRAGNFRGERGLQDVSVSGDGVSSERRRMDRRAARRTDKKYGVSLAKAERQARRRSKRTSNFRGDRGLQGVSVVGGGVSSERRRMDRRAARRTDKAYGVSLAQEAREAKRRGKRDGGFRGARSDQLLSVERQKRRLNRTERHLAGFMGEPAVRVMADSRKREAKTHREKEKWGNVVHREGDRLGQEERQALRQARRTGDFMGERSVRVRPDSKNRNDKNHRAQEQWGNAVRRQGDRLGQEEREGAKQARRKEAFMGESVVRVRPQARAIYPHSKLTQRVRKRAPYVAGLEYGRVEARWYAEFRYGWQHIKGWFSPRIVSAAKRPITPKGLR